MSGEIRSSGFELSGLNYKVKRMEELSLADQYMFNVQESGPEHNMT